MGEKVTIKDVQQKASELERRLDGVEEKVADIGEDLRELTQGDIRELKENVQKILESIGAFLHQKNSRADESAREERNSTEQEDRAESRVNPSQDTMRMPFPSFDGNGYRTWRDRCEQFFVLEGTPEDQRLKFLIMAMEGRAFSWQRHYLRSTGKDSLNWKFFLDAVGTRFDTSSYDDPMSELVNLKQNASLIEYMELFDELISRVSVDDQTTLSCFLGGLKGPLEKALRLQMPRNVNEALGMARIQEELLLELSLQPYHLFQGRSRPCSSSSFNSYTKNYKTSTDIDNNGNNSNTENHARNFTPKPYQPYQDNQRNVYSNNSGQASSHTSKRYSQPGYKPNSRGFREQEKSEVAIRLSKGLCKFCGKKYDPNHRNVCKVWGRLNAIWLEQDEKELVEEEGQEEENMQMSLNALQGLVGGDTMQLMGSIKKQKLPFLVDTSSSSNNI